MWLFVKGIKMGPRGCGCWDRNRRRWEREPSEGGLSKPESCGYKSNRLGKGDALGCCQPELAAGRGWAAAAPRVTPVAAAMLPGM